jgi:hypothetical protein
MIRFASPMKSAMKALAGRSYRSRGVPSLRDLRVAHHDDPVRDRQRLFLVMGDIDRRQAEPLLDLPDLLAHMAAQLGIEVRQRLVEQQHLRLQHQRARHRHALLLAARQLGRQPRAEPFRPTVSSPASAPPHLGLAKPERQAIADVLQHAHVREQRIGLEHHRHVPVGGRQQRHILPADQDAPLARLSSPAISRSVVVLPQPEGPSSVTSVPRRCPGRQAFHRHDLAEDLGHILEPDRGLS